MKGSVFALVFSSLVGSVLASSNSAVKVLTSDNIDQILDGSKPAFVKFYATWCGHCKNLAPTWDELADHFHQQGDQVIIAKAEVEQHQAIADRFKIQGYPTLKWFPAGKSSTDENASEYTGGDRGLDSLKAFVNEKLGVQGKSKSTLPSDVVELTSDTFDAKVLNGPQKYTLVDFYASWCGHCKTLAPIFDLVGKAFSIESDVVLAKIDADLHKDIGSRYNINSFPTLKLFVHGEAEPQEYNQARSEEAIIAFLNEKAGTHRLPGGELLPEAGRLAKLDTLAQEFFAATSDKYDQIIKKARKISTEANSKAAKYYVQTMEKIKAQESVSYLQNEMARLKKLAGNMGADASRDWFMIRGNILSSFSADAVKAKADDAVDAAKQKVGAAKEKVQAGAKKAKALLAETTDKAEAHLRDEL